MTIEFAILGLLAERPMHGYAIEAIVAERGMRSWTPIGFSSIYQALDQLVARGWALATDEPAPGRGRPRRVHRLTAKGRRHWRTTAIAALEDPRCSDSEFLIAYSVLPLLPAADVLAALRRRRERLTESLAALQADLDQARPVPPHVETMFSFTRTRLAGQRDWLDQTIPALTTEASS